MGQRTISVILGTSRPERRSEWVSKFLVNELKNQSFQVNLIDVKDFPIKFDGDKADPKYAEMISASQVILIVMPEYNHSYPGQLKSLLDSEFKIYEGKLAVIASVSSGNFGGARAVEHLIPVLTNFKMNFNGLVLHFPDVEKNFNQTGECLDEATKNRTSETISKIKLLV